MMLPKHSALYASGFPISRTHGGQTEDVVIPNTDPLACAICSQNVKLSSTCQGATLPAQSRIDSSWVAGDNRLSDSH